MSSKLQVKDLINVGIFAAVYIVLMMVVVTVAGIIPIFYVVAPIIVAIVCAPVYMLLLMKTPKTGSVFILSVLMAFIFIGGAYYASIWVVLMGIIVEIFLRNGGHKSLKKVKLSYLIFSLTTVGPYFGIIVAKNVFLVRAQEYYGVEYANTLESLLPPWAILLLLIATALGAYFGAKFADKMLKKHFRKAGIV